MPSFDKLKFTANGLALQANAQAGSKLTFTKIKLGKGTTSGDVASLVNLVNPVIEANIIVGTLADNVYTVQANATNEGLADGFYWTEMGLFAQDSNGNEILCAYSSTTDETDYVPSASESSYMKRIKFAIVVGNATNITFVKSDDTYIDVLTFNEKIDEINTSLSNIGKKLEACATTEELDKAKTDIGKEIEAVSKSVAELEKNVNEQIKTISDNYATKDSVTQLGENFTEQLKTTSDAMTTLSQNTANSIKTTNENVSNIANALGTASIEGIGDGTIKGAVAKLFEMVNAIPAITSGTADPSGGEDGDVYIQHE